MGLLARRRSVNRESQPASAPAARVDAPPDSPRPLIRPEDLAGTPGWTQLPPPAPLLPPVPFVVSQSFSKDLATWRAPEFQLGPLEHGVSELAPQGTIAAVAVADTEPLVRLEAADASGDKSALPLAHVGSGRPGATSEEVALGFRSLPHGPEIRPAQTVTGLAPRPATYALPVSDTRPIADKSPEAPGGAGPRPTMSRSDTMPIARSTPAAPPGVGSAPAAGTGTSRSTPAATIPAPAATPATPAPATAAMPVTRSLVESPVPPQLPLIQLKTAPLPVPSTSDLPSEPVTVQSAMPGTDAPVSGAPLVGDRPPLERSGDDPAAPSAPAEAASVGGDPHGRTDTVTAPGLAQQPPPKTDHLQPPLAGSPTAGTSGVVPPAVSPLLGTPVAGGQSGQTSDAAPRTADSALRSGLGAPLHNLPPTAASLDVASLVTSYGRRPRTANPSAPMPLAVAAAGGSHAGRAAGAMPAPLPGAPVRQAIAEAFPTAPTYAEMSSLPVVTAEPERQADLRSDAADSLPPVPTATVALAPFQAMQPLPKRSEAGPEREGRAVKTLIGRRHGVNLDDVTVDRSPASAGKARAAGAAAFTSEDRVVIPKSYGTLDAGPGQALLAHELTHAAQQRKIGPRALPAESSSAGRALEAEAVGAELVYIAPALSTGKLGPVPDAPGRSAPRPATWVGASGSVPSAPHAPAGLPVARSAPASVDDAALSAALMRLGAVTSGPSAPVAAPHAGGVVATVSTPAPAPAPAAPIQRAADDGQGVGVAVPPTPSRSVFEERPSDQELDDLATWLYPLISFKIRGELWDDRQRGGLLTGFYRR